MKAQVYLRDQEDIPGFREVWAQHFPVQPATTIIATATPGFIMPESRIEINTIALAKDGKTGEAGCRAGSAAVSGRHRRRSAPAICCSSPGLMAVRDGSLVPAAKADPDAAVLRDSGQSRSCGKFSRRRRRSARPPERACRNAVRIQQFHADLADLPATLEVWSEAMDGLPLPLSPVEVPWLPVPDARLQLDLWIYVPD